MSSSNDQSQFSASIPVRLVKADGSAFYDASGGGGGGGATAPYAATPLGYQQITALSASTALSVPSTTTFATVSAEATDLRWRDDGTAPTATVGMPLYVGSPATFAGNLSALRFIQQATGAILNISYYK